MDDKLAHENRPPIAADELRYPYSTPTTGEEGWSVTAIAEDLWWARIPLTMSLNHINVYLLRDADGWVLIDSGLHHSLSQTAWDAILALPEMEGLPPKALICTHYHYDHTGMAHTLCERWGIPLYMSALEHLTMRCHHRPFPTPAPTVFLHMMQRVAMPEIMGEAIAASLRKDPFIPPVQESFIRLQAGDALHIGARYWQILIGGGHSPEHICLYAPAKGQTPPLLIAGDQLIPRISSNIAVHPYEMDANPLAVWLQSLDMLEQLPEDTVVMPSHQEVFVGVRTRCQNLRGKHQQALQQTEEYIAQNEGANAHSIMQVIYPRLRGPIDTIMAMGEMLAHLNHLHFANRIACDIDAATGAAHYRVVGANAAAKNTAPRWGVLAIARTNAL